jgi:hypothetical protein
MLTDEDSEVVIDCEKGETEDFANLNGVMETQSNGVTLVE